MAEPLVLTGGAEFQVNTTTAGDQLSPGITSFADGGYAILWKHNDYPTFQRYDAAGNPVGTETQTMWTKGFAAVAADGTSIVAYDSGTELRARRHDASGNSIGGSFIVNRLPLSGILRRLKSTQTTTATTHSSGTVPPQSRDDLLSPLRFRGHSTDATKRRWEVVDYYRLFMPTMNPAGDLASSRTIQCMPLIKGIGRRSFRAVPQSDGRRICVVGESRHHACRKLRCAVFPELVYLRSAI